MERFKLIPSAYLFWIRDKKILLLRRANTGFEDGNYGLPAGHAEAHESFTNAAIREINEEIGVHFLPEQLSVAHVMHRRGADERVDFFFTTSADGKPQNLEPEKCDDLNWFPLNNLPSNTIPYIRAAIENFQKGIFYSEFGW